MERRSTKMMGLGLLAVAGALAGCSKVESCRPGTLFLTVALGPYASSAGKLDVDVTLSAMADAGSAPQQTELTLKPGSQRGGVEVQFPAGYPAGQSATVTLTLLSGAGAELAERVVTELLPSGCGAVTVDFGLTDAGTDAGGGASGGGAGKRGTGGTAGAAGAGGAGGGTGGAATGGGAGGASTGGAVGTGGTPGTGGAVGTGGTPGTGGAGGCVPTGPENCFNNIDDDCDGKIDCADPDCGPTVAQCVALDPTSAPIGMLSGVGPGACATPGFDQPTSIVANLNPLDCSTQSAGKGCICTPAPVTCTATLSGFQTAKECSDSSSTGDLAAKFSTGDDKSCTAGPPAWTPDAAGYIYGVATSAFSATTSGCTPSGTPIIPTPTWGSRGTFCATATIGGGCGAGKVCVPAGPSSTVCQLFDGVKTTCPAAVPSRAPWYTGVSSGITCGPCSCGSPIGATCDNAEISFGNDGTCSGLGTVGSKSRACFGGGVSKPGVQFVGAISAPCQAMSTVGGTATPTGPKTLCCSQ